MGTCPKRKNSVFTELVTRKYSFNKISESLIFSNTLRTLITAIEFITGEPRVLKKSAIIAKNLHLLY